MPFSAFFGEFQSMSKNPAKGDPGPLSSTSVHQPFSTLRRHVVRDDVQQQPHPAVAQRLHERVELRLGAQLGVQPGGIGHVVPVGAAPAGLQDGRGVQVGDPQGVQVRNEAAGVLEPEPPVELEPVGGRRDAERRHGVSPPEGGRRASRRGTGRSRSRDSLFVPQAGPVQEIRIDRLAQVVVDVLGVEERDVEGQVAAHVHGLLEAAEKLEVAGLLAEVVRDRVDPFLERESYAFLVELEADAVSLLQQPADDGRVEVFRRYRLAQPGVQRDPRRGVQRIGDRHAHAREEAHHGGVLVVDLPVARLRLRRGSGRG